MRHSMAVPIRAEDLRPPSLLKRRDLDSKMAIGGILGVVGAHLLVPGAIAGVVAFLAATGIGRTQPRDLKEDRVVEARFVKLGKPPDPKKIPDRKVPIKSTAPTDAVTVSKNMDPPKVQKPDAGRPPPKAEEDIVKRLGDRAQAFAEIAQKREEEGDPQGIEDGTETTAKAGDLYRGQLVMFFKRGWTIPTTLGDTSKLTTRARVEITPDRHIGAHEIVKSSGEPLFDQSVEDRFNELRSLGTSLPEPPPEVRSQFEGTWQLDVNFIGKKAD